LYDRVPSSSPSAKRPGGGGGGTRGDGAVCVALELKKPTRTSPLGVELEADVDRRGVRVVALDPRGVGCTSGRLRVGDVIFEVNGTSVVEPNAAAALLRGSSRVVAMRVWRAGPAARPPALPPARPPAVVGLTAANLRALNAQRQRQAAGRAASPAAPRRQEVVAISPGSPQLTKPVTSPAPFSFNTSHELDV